MLPLRLEIKNFLAYQSPDPLILEDLHLACLTGENGAGKSSLLDAMTWALWGRARTRSDDELIHLGQEEMMVTLDFMQDGQRFRVTRRRKLGRMRQDGRRSPGQSELFLFGYDDERKAFAAINEPSIRETQMRISQLLRLDHEIFVNSAFLQQGQADAFTTKTPTQRKEILSEILGLNRWVYYEEKAKDELRNIQSEINLLTMRINEFEEDIAKEPTLRHDLNYARQQQVEVQTEVERAEASLAEVQGADLEYRHAEELLAAARYNIREREKDRITLFEEIERHQQRLAAYQQVVASADSIRQGYAQLEEARSADLALGDKLRELNTLNQHISSLERQLSEARQEIELEQRELLTSVDNDRQIVIIGEQAKADLEEVDRLIMLLEALETERDSCRENINGLNEELTELRTTNKTLKAEMEDIKARQELINSAAEPRCPVCLQPLDEAHKQELHDKFQAEGTQRGDAFRANAIRMDEIRAEIQSLEAQAADAEKELKSLPTFRTRRGGLEQQIVDAVEAEQRIQTYQIKLDELDSILVKERFGEALRNQLQDAYAERDNLGYDSGTHDAVRENLNLYLVYQDKAKELEFAQQAIPQVEENLQNTQKRLERCEKSIQEYMQQAARHETELEHLKIKVAEMRHRQEELSRQRTLLRNAEEKVSSVEQQLHSIAQMRERRAKMIDRKAELQEKEGVYEQLKIAFGSKGVPAMIIEAAIPELEDAANRLLSRMTNNRMHLRFDTQREKKTGGVMETLDILISDELGTRDYSLYSGGEAFRVDFAIRIALSQMLARRAGAQLRTLFIDEGFGTQDAVGRERLVEAINSIQDDFDLILVITHIDELRDAFPALIEVTKTPKGSFATVR